MFEQIRRHPTYQKTAKFITSEHLLDDITHIDIALSGGADSVCLLALLSAMQSGIELRAHHIRHGLRDDLEDAQIARHTAELFNMDYIQTDLQWPDGIPQSNIEEAARRARYTAFFFQVPKQGALAIAHHGDENLETAIWRLGRGCGIEGFALAPKRIYQDVVLIRPLLILSKDEIYQFLNDMDLKWAEDPTNASDHYRRNRIRHTILPEMKAEAMADDCIYRSLIDVRHDADALTSFAESFVHSQPMHFERWFCPWERWNALNHEAQFQVIRHAARHVSTGHCPTREFVQKAIELLHSPQINHRQIENGRIHIGFSHTGVMMWPQMDPPQPEIITIPIPCCDLPVWSFAKLSVWHNIPQDSLKNTTSTLHILANAIQGELTIRPASCFSELQRSNGNLTKLSEALRNQGVPDIWRKIWPVLCDARGPLWVLGGMRTLNAAPAVQEQPAITFSVHWNS